MPLETVGVTELPPERFDEVLTPGALATFQHSLARGRELLGSRTVWNVNSTAFGGGVAEMLRSLIGYVRGAGIDAPLGRSSRATRSSSASPSASTTGCMACRATAARLGESERSAYERRCAANAAALVEMLRPDDVVILHDPQTAGHDPGDPGGDRCPADLARAHRARPAQRHRARGLGLPQALRRAGRRLRLLAGGVRLGRARP